METFCTTSRHSKYRPTLNSNSFYQPSTYSRNYRQNEYGFANSTRNSALLWHERPHPPPKKSKGKLCSIALAAAAFIVLVAVLSIAGLALYMGALRTEPANPLSTYTCSAKIARGDRFISNLPEKARRYRLLFESLYQRSILGPSIVSCNIEKFGNDTFTIYYKVTLNRRKIPRHIYNIEKSLKDILLGDALSRKPVFRNVRFDPRSISIKQTADPESYQRVITKPKELPKVTTNHTFTPDQHAKKKPVIEEVDVKEEDLPVIQGSFKISKTEADITEKKENVNVGSVEISTSKPKTTTTTKTPKRPSLKETSITSALFKLTSNSKKTTTERITTINTEDIAPTVSVDQSSIITQKINDVGIETRISANLNFDQPTGLNVDNLFNQPPDLNVDNLDTSSSISNIRFTYPTTPKIENFNKFNIPLGNIENYDYTNPSTLKIEAFNTQSTNSNFKFNNPTTPKIDIFNTPTLNPNYKPINPSTPKLESFNPVLFSVGPNVFNQEPWVPLYHIPETRSEEPPKYESNPQRPVYTSFTETRTEEPPKYEPNPQRPIYTSFAETRTGEPPKYEPNPQRPIYTSFAESRSEEPPKYEPNPQPQRPIYTTFTEARPDQSQHPIYTTFTETRSEEPIKYEPHPQPQRPIYTSFTNPGLSFHSFDTEKIGSTSLKGHPIPVNKIAELTEPSIWETTARTYNSDEIDQIQFTTSEPLPEDKDDLYDLHTSDGNYDEPPSFVEVETLKYVPGAALNTSEPVESERAEANSFEKTYNETLQAVMVTDRTNNYKLKQNAVLKNISSIFHSLASSLGIAPIHFNNIRQNQTKPPLDTTTTITSTTTPTTSTTPSTTTIEEVIKIASNVGQGLAEVVDADELSLMMQTTKAPLVTLLPVKSNSGVGRPIRPRPKPDNDSISENRSFPSDSSKLNLNDFTNPIKYIETEVVTSVSSEEHKVKLNKNKLPATSAPLIQTTTPQAFPDEVAVLSMNSSSSTDSDGFEYLTPEKLKQLSEISKLSDNSTNGDDEGVISTKAVSSSYTINHSGFKILTKTFNKIPTSLKDEEKKASSGSYNSFFLDVNNKSDCSNFTVKCGDGQCLPDTTRCNQLVDCNDGSDEKNCNCADYLRSQFLLRKICDGIVDCWDFSDENHCEWCKPGQYVCGNSKMCINRASICDGVRDCPHGDDERQCVTVAPTLVAADEFPYHSEGYLMVRKHGKWGKLCVDNFEKVVAKSQTSWEISDLGQAVCKAMTYQSLDNVKILTENKKKSINRRSRYFELTYSFQNETKSSLTFENTTCRSGEVVRVKCQSLECGARPQATKQVARIVGGGNAGLGAWPWQAALYKEGEFQCGATLISEKWLLSAGHCFYHSLDEHWVARLGALRRGTALPSPYEQLRPIVQIILHPGYVDAGFINDISLLKMEVPVIFSDYVRPICLPPAGVSPKDGRMCTVVGWGQLFEIGRIFPDTLQEVQIPVISTAECRKRTLFLPLYRVTDDMFCAGYDRGGRDACLGDSGGPLMCPEADGRWVLHGITSNGYGCARAYRPGVYTKVSNYINWINPYIYNDNATITPIKNTCTGHRCPLGECLPKSRLCNGFIECSDGSDEVGCISN